MTRSGYKVYLENGHHLLVLFSRCQALCQEFYMDVFIYSNYPMKQIFVPILWMRKLSLKEPNNFSKVKQPTHKTGAFKTRSLSSQPLCSTQWGHCLNLLREKKSHICISAGASVQCLNPKKYLGWWDEHLMVQALSQIRPHLPPLKLTQNVVHSQFPLSWEKRSVYSISIRDG